MNKVIALVLSALICAPLISLADGVQFDCKNVAILVAMASSKSISDLKSAFASSKDEYITKIVYRARSFELEPNNRYSAAELFYVLPKNGAEDRKMLSMGDLLCDNETVCEMNVLVAMRDRLPEDFSKAVIVAPDKMNAYINFAFVAVQDPHNDYAVQMKRVCKARKSELRISIGQLPQKSREWFVNHIFDVQRCRAVALPESD